MYRRSFQSGYLYHSKGPHPLSAGGDAGGGGYGAGPTPACASLPPSGFYLFQKTIASAREAPAASHLQQLSPSNLPESALSYDHVRELSRKVHVGHFKSRSHYRAAPACSSLSNLRTSRVCGCRKHIVRLPCEASGLRTKQAPSAR